MLESLVSSCLLVTLSEMGDKTQLLALSLAIRFKKPWPVMGGILVATLLNHGLAAYSGAWISSFIRPDILGYGIAAAFILFGFWMLKPDTFDEKDERAPFGAFMTTAILFFIAEMGDKTQLVTVALAAQYQATLWVIFGTTLGMLAADGLAVFLGVRLTRKIPMKFIRWFAAAIFFVFGAVGLAAAFRAQ